MESSRQDAEKVRQPVLFIWSIRPVRFVWLHETGQTDQITRETGLGPDVKASEILTCVWQRDACRLFPSTPDPSNHLLLHPADGRGSEIVKEHVMQISSL